MAGPRAMPEYGIQSMLEESHDRHLSDLDEAERKKNIAAACKVARILRTALGPRGMDRTMLVDHSDNLSVKNNDAAAMVNEPEVKHPSANKILEPAAKILEEPAGRAQEEEVRDGSNLAISLADELLGKAKELIRMGLHPCEIIVGYTKAMNKTIEVLEDLSCRERLGEHGC